MNYNELKEQVDKNRRNVSKAKHKKKKIEEELKELRDSKHSIEVNYNQEINNLKTAAHDEYLAKELKPFEDEIARIQDSINKNNEMYTQKLSDLTEENVADLYTGEQEITEEIKASLNVLQDRLRKVISKRFQEELELQLDNQAIDLEGQNLETLINYFNRQSILIEKMSRKTIKFDIMGYLSNQFLLTNPLNSIGNQEATIGKLDRDKLNIGVLVIICFLITLVAAKYVFPVYLLLLIVYSAYNIARNYHIFSALIAQKVIKDNIKQVDEALKQKVLAELERQKEQLQKKHETEINLLQVQLNQKKSMLNNATINAENTFTFDESNIRKSFDAAMRAKENKEMSLIAEQRQLISELESLYRELKESEDILKSMAGSIQQQYLDFEKVGNSIIFEPNFIIDVKDTKPIFFEHPEKSCLFVYDELEDVIDFIRLISVQLRIKLNPFNLTVTVIDQAHMGTDYLVMQPSEGKDDAAIKSLYRILTSKEEIDTRFLEYNDDILKRIKNIKRNFKNIVEYNNYMVEHDSLTESYEFLFFQDPDINSLQSKVLQQMLLNGSDVGIFSHLFIEASELFEMGDTAKKLITNIGSIYLLRDGELFKRAKDFALEKMVKSSNS